MSEYLFLLCLMEEVSKYIASIRIGFQSFLCGEQLQIQFKVIFRS